MKHQLLTGFTVLAMSCASMSYANITLYSNSIECDSVSGQWTGSGKISHWLVGECVYAGGGTVSAMDGAGHFTLAVSVDKKSGSFMCPGHRDQTLNGVCQNGVVTVDTGYGSLSGNFTENEGSATGTLDVNVIGKVNVDIKFYRNS